MTEAEVQAELKDLARELEKTRIRLLTLHNELPASVQEALIHAGEADLDLATELRSAIECIVSDELEPAIRNLRRAAESTTPSGEEGPPEWKKE